ncbi:MAG: hypothetical protein MUD14_11175, partial [Hydrococcus sp. Prado102]|nr:hypothetical protein [Hydrococcus sp. Prado102]
ICYPWNPADPETEVYFEQLEQKFSAIDSFDAEELDSQSERFFTCLHQCWDNIETNRVKYNVIQRFGHFVPCDWIDAIAEQATCTISNNLSAIDRLVACVKPLLSNWDSEDLLVFARPLAYTMRGESSVKVAPWDELSEIEKARLTLKIAREVLIELEEAQQQ